MPNAATTRLRDLDHGSGLTDLITGLPRPTVFERHLHLALQRARRSGGHVGLVVVDVDDFDRIDRRWGAAAGDGLLREVGRRIGAQLRQPDMVTRLEADCFAASCEDLESADHLELVVARIRGALARSFTVGSKAVRLTIGIGAAVTDGRLPDDELGARAHQDLIDHRHASAGRL